MIKIIKRENLIKSLDSAMGRSKIVILLGPRQCGKTTLAKMYAKKRRYCEFFDLENPALNLIFLYFKELKKLG